VELEETFDEHERRADRFARLVQWPMLIFLALLEIGWLTALGYLASRFI
jgi:hypothetical protein